MIRMHPLPVAVAVLGAAVAAGAMVASAVVVGAVTDRIVLRAFDVTGAQVTTADALWGATAVMAVAVLRGAGTISRRYFAGMAAERVQATLRDGLSQKYLQLPMSWYQRLPAGQLLAHADSDAQMAAEVMGPLPYSLGVAFLMLFSAIALVLVDWLIALVALLIFPIMYVLNRKYSAVIEEPAALVQAGVGEVSSIAHESFDGALVIKTLGRESLETERFDASTEVLKGHRLQVGYIRAVFEAVLDALPNLGIAAVVLIGSVRIADGAMTPGDLVQVATLFSLLAFPMRVFGYFLEMLPKSVVAKRRVDGVLSEPGDPQVGAAALPGGSLSLEVRDVSFAYIQGQPVLSGVSFAVDPGEVVAIVGSTGSGKSTLCSAIAGLVTPDSGQIFLSGQPISEVNPVIRTEAVSLVFQESFLFADTVESNITLDRVPTGEMSARAAAKIAAADRFISELPEGYGTVVGERGITLSGGQRQRVALARALYQAPRLMLLDDATAAVDAAVESEILNGLRSNLEMTTLIVAQRVSTIQLADRVVYLAGGVVAGVGRHEDLLDHPGYEALVRAYEEASV